MEAPNFLGIFHLMICKSNSVKKYPKFVLVIKMYLNGIIPISDFVAVGGEHYSFTNHH